MEFEKVHSFIINKLEKELPKYLTYHNVYHTKEVLHNARHIAVAENITGDDLDLLLTGALFHDTGFIETYKDHEEISCQMARKYLPQYDYTDEQIEQVCKLIMDTKIPKKADKKL